MLLLGMAGNSRKAVACFASREILERQLHALRRGRRYRNRLDSIYTQWWERHQAMAAPGWCWRVEPQDTSQCVFAYLDEHATGDMVTTVWVVVKMMVPSGSPKY